MGLGLTGVGSATDSCVRRLEASSCVHCACVPLRLLRDSVPTLHLTSLQIAPVPQPLAAAPLARVPCNMLSPSPQALGPPATFPAMACGKRRAGEQRWYLDRPGSGVRTALAAACLHYQRRPWYWQPARARERHTARWAPPAFPRAGAATVPSHGAASAEGRSGDVFQCNQRHRMGLDCQNQLVIGGPLRCGPRLGGGYLLRQWPGRCVSCIVKADRPRA